MARFDLDLVPFSTFGSWMSISQNPLGTDSGIWLSSHHNGTHPVLSLHPGGLSGDDWSIDAGVTLLRIRQGIADVSCAFANETTLHLSGNGSFVFRAAQHVVLYEELGGDATFNSRQGIRRYLVHSVKGTLSVENAWTPKHRNAGTVEVLPDSDGLWECTVTEFWSVAPRLRHDPWDQVRTDAESRFEEFLRKAPDAPERFADARELATYVNYSAVVSPAGMLKRPAMFMSKNWMCNVWSWDNCFNAMALASGNPDLAWDQLLTLADYQDVSGAYFDSINDIGIHYNFCKPPIHGWAVREVMARTPAEPRPGVLKYLYDSLCKWCTFWTNHRTVPGQSLPYYLHGNDSGWDNGTMFDSGVPLIAPDLSAFLADTMLTLSDLAVGLGLSSEESNRWRRAGDALIESLIDQLWNGERFIAKHALTGESVESECLLPYMTILLGESLPNQIRGKLVDGIQEFVTKYGLATEKPSSSEYTDDGYWRGPIWAPSTYIAISGLERCDASDLALDLAEKFCALCEKSGFAENYDALTGEGLRDQAYTWTSSVFLLLAERLHKREM